MFARRYGAWAQMVENSVDHGACGDERHDPHLGAAPGAPERIDLEDLSQQLGPAPPRLPESPAFSSSSS